MTNAVLKRDYVLLMDKSASMSTRDCNGQTRWDAALEGTLGLAAHLTKLDPDGIDLYFFNSSFTRHPNVTDTQVAELFAGTDPQGGTDLANALGDALNRFKAQQKPTTIVVVTDGDTNDRKAVERAIIEASKVIEVDEQLAIQFVQIGADPKATEMLKSFDDDLVSRGAKFDIVDHVTQRESETLSFTELLLKAIND